MFSGERLKEERERLKYTQISFSEIAGISSRAQINYEKGERTPDGNYLAEITKIGVDVMYVLTGVRSQPATVKYDVEQPSSRLKAAEDIGGYTASSKPLNKREQMLLANYRESDEEEKRSIERTARAYALYKGKEGTSGE